MQIKTRSYRCRNAGVADATGPVWRAWDSHLLLAGRLTAPPWHGVVRQSLKKLTYELPCDSVVPQPGFYPGSTCVNVDSTFLCKSPKLGVIRPSIHRWTLKQIAKNPHKGILLGKKNGTGDARAMWTNLKIIMLTEKSQMKKGTLTVWPCL